MTINVKNYDVLLSPIVTEKASLISENNQVAFKVALKASKIDIKNAIESIFKVKVKAVNTIVTKGKIKVFKGKKGRRSDYKKAIVTLAEGNSIDLSGGV